MTLWYSYYGISGLKIKGLPESNRAGSNSGSWSRLSGCSWCNSSWTSHSTISRVNTEAGLIKTYLAVSWLVDWVSWFPLSVSSLFLKSKPRMRASPPPLPPLAQSQLTSPICGQLLSAAPLPLSPPPPRFRRGANWPPRQLIHTWTEP